jgi:hypothetical protein
MFPWVYDNADNLDCQYQPELSFLFVSLSQENLSCPAMVAAAAVCWAAALILPSSTVGESDRLG